MGIASGVQSSSWMPTIDISLLWLPMAGSDSPLPCVVMGPFPAVLGDALWRHKERKGFQKLNLHNQKPFRFDRISTNSIPKNIGDFPYVEKPWIHPNRPSRNYWERICGDSIKSKGFLVYVNLIFETLSFLCAAKGHLPKLLEKDPLPRMVGENLSLP